MSTIEGNIIDKTLVLGYTGSGGGFIAWLGDPSDILMWMSILGVTATFVYTCLGIATKGRVLFLKFMEWRKKNKK
ncbi:MAG: hypothetical protein JKY53_00110 [Flavobacteriales bacterium]|nr:hypothetical protein [Flavobacteriales bacterium]